MSTTPRDPDWNNTEVIDRDVAATIARLNDEPGQDIVRYGYGSVTRLMLEHGLLDELRLWMHSLILGDGRPGDLLFGAMPAVGFEHRGARRPLVTRDHASQSPDASPRTESADNYVEDLEAGA